jgi:hypothetical protein
MISFLVVICLFISIFIFPSNIYFKVEKHCLDKLAQHNQLQGVIDIKQLSKNIHENK